MHIPRPTAPRRQRPGLSHARPYCRETIPRFTAIGRALEKLKKPEAEARRRAGNARGGRGGEVGIPKKTDLQTDTVAAIQTGKTDVLVSQALGIGSTSYWRAKTIVRAAEDGDEKAADQLVEVFGPRWWERLA